MRMIRDGLGLQMCKVDNCRWGDWAGEFCGGHQVDFIMTNKGLCNENQGDSTYTEGVGMWGSDHQFYNSYITTGW